MTFTVINRKHGAWRVYTAPHLMPRQSGKCVSRLFDQRLKGIGSSNSIPEFLVLRVVEILWEMPK